MVFFVVFFNPKLNPDDDDGCWVTSAPSGGEGGRVRVAPSQTHTDSHRNAWKFTVEGLVTSRRGTK